MKRYYDGTKNRLVYVGEEATPEMWDKRWGEEDLEKLFFPSRYCMEDRIIVDTTRNYLSTGARILEGGCGLGEKVYFLTQAGFDVIGIDSAAKTVEKLHQFMPDLDIRYGDLMQLDFTDCYFDGYWSLGVVEHFYNGYGYIAREMYRILKPGGYLFMTVPAMSRLRKMKATIGIYPRFSENEVDISSFYQFVYDSEEVQKSFFNFGFQLVEKRGWAVREGVRSEITGSRLLIGFLLKFFEKPTWHLLKNYCNHMDLYVFRKQV